MTLADVNVLLAAFRGGHQDHRRCRAWLDQEMASGRFGIATQALAAVVRIASNRRIFSDPSSTADVLAFAERLLQDPHAAVIQPGPRHWSILADLLRVTQLKGNDVTDAWFAALAIEAGCTWVTLDQGFKRFPGLATRAP